jgi:hypothetical protein
MAQVTFAKVFSLPKNRKRPKNAKINASLNSIISDDGISNFFAVFCFISSIKNS